MSLLVQGKAAQQRKKAKLASVVEEQKNIVQAFKKALKEKADEEKKIMEIMKTAESSMMQSLKNQERKVVQDVYGKD